MALRSVLALALVFWLGIVATLPAQQTEGGSHSSPTFEEKLRQSRAELLIDNGNHLSGKGAVILRQAISTAQYVLIGEDHITREIPRFAAAVCNAMVSGGFTAMAIETGPQVARMVGLSLGKPDRISQMSSLTHRYPDSVAFLNDRQENDLVAYCAEASDRKDFHLWGIDQEFLGSAGWILDQILATHPGPGATAALKRLKSEEQEAAGVAEKTGDAGKLLLFTVSDAELSKNTLLLKQEGTREANELLRELVVSHDIYRKNTQDDPGANFDRARLLKQNFQHDLDLASSTRQHQRVLVKMGEWHLYKGFNPLGQRDVGNYIAELADVQGVRSLHICVLGAKGVHSLYGGYHRPGRSEPFVMNEDPSYRWLKPAIDNQLPDSWTLYDLRRLRFQQVSGLDVDFRRLIDGYDLLVIVPELTPADMIQ